MNHVEVQNTQKKSAFIKNLIEKLEILVVSKTAEINNNCKTTEVNKHHIGEHYSQINYEEEAQKAELIAQLRERHQTLSDFYKKIIQKKKENAQLKKETEAVSSYMHDLMEAASVLEPLKKYQY